MNPGPNPAGDRQGLKHHGPTTVRRWAALVFLLASPGAEADLFSGKGLLRLVNSGEPSKYAQFAGYVAGVQDSYLASTGKGLVCIPRNVHLSQTMKSVEQYLSANASRLHEPGRVLVSDALRTIYPCTPR